MDIHPYLKLTVEKDASDVYFSVGSPVRVKLEGKVMVVGKTVLTPEMTEAAAQSIMDKIQWATFQKSLEIDFAIAVTDPPARFRVNVFRQQGMVSMVLRNIKSKILSIDELHLPPILKELIMPRLGLLLMCGATNSGKSTTLAAMIDYRNSHAAGHILTIEDPIEFVHPHKKSLVNQRELTVDTHSYAKALKSSLRESPDVILIGEIRDQETMEAALGLSNTGHLAISTLHANNAHQAMQRVINIFPQVQHKQLFMDLAMNLVAVIAQRLCIGLDSKRVAAVEVMIKNPHIADLILNGRIDELREAMENSGTNGMQTFDMALHELYRQGRVTLEEALNSADSRTNLEAKITFS